MPKKYKLKVELSDYGIRDLEKKNKEKIFFTLEELKFELRRVLRKELYLRIKKFRVKEI